MMGRGLERLAEVPAGCVLAIGGLDRCILKSATLSSTPACRPLAPMLFQARLPPAPRTPRPSCASHQHCHCITLVCAPDELMASEWYSVNLSLAWAFWASSLHLSA